MINEGIHTKLKEVYDEFDRHARIHNIDYSVDADYRNAQGYRLLDCNDVPGFLRHIANFVKDRSVNLDYDGSPVNYDHMRENDFSVNTYNPLFMFTLKSIQEENMLNEDQYKHPTKKHTRDQAQFPSSSREHETAFTYKNGGKKKKKKDKTLSDSKEFGDRLMGAISEQIVAAVDPEILFTRNQADLECPEAEEALKDALQAESTALTSYISLLEATENSADAIVLENMIEKCTNHINHLHTLMGDSDDRTS